MYAEAFGLRQLPFNNTHDPRFFFSTPDHEEALATLIYSAGELKGLTMLGGECGTGKSLLARLMLNHFGSRVSAAWLGRSQWTPTSLLPAVCHAFDLEIEPNAPSVRMMNALAEFAAGKQRERQPVIVILDDADALAGPSVDEVSLLTNLECGTNKLVQVILMGRPGLDELLLMPASRQLRQRLFRVMTLRPLTRQQTGDYVEHRLQAAGGDGQQIFEPAALDVIHELSRGVPRIINTIADSTLLSAFSRNLDRVDASLIRSLPDLRFHSEEPDVKKVAENSVTPANAGVQGTAPPAQPGPYPQNFQPPPIMPWMFPYPTPISALAVIPAQAGIQPSVPPWTMTYPMPVIPAQAGIQPATPPADASLLARLQAIENRLDSVGPRGEKPVTDTPQSPSLRRKPESSEPQSPSLRRKPESSEPQSPSLRRKPESSEPRRRLDSMQRAPQSPPTQAAGRSDSGIADLVKQVNELRREVSRNKESTPATPPATDFQPIIDRLDKLESAVNRRTARTTPPHADDSVRDIGPQVLERMNAMDQALRQLCQETNPVEPANSRSNDRRPARSVATNPSLPNEARVERSATSPGMPIGTEQDDSQNAEADAHESTDWNDVRGSANSTPNAHDSLHHAPADGPLNSPARHQDEESVDDEENAVDQLAANITADDPPDGPAVPRNRPVRGARTRRKRPNIRHGAKAAVPSAGVDRVKEALDRIQGTPVPKRPNRSSSQESLNQALDAIVVGAAHQKKKPTGGIKP